MYASIDSRSPLVKLKLKGLAHPSRCSMKEMKERGDHERLSILHGNPI